MSHIVEMSQQTFDLARQVVAFTELKSVRLSSCQVETSPQAPKKDVDASFQVLAKAKANRSEPEQFMCKSSFKLQVTVEDAGAAPFTIRVDFESIYVLPRDRHFSRKQLDAFAETNGLLNVWPYWREFVQTMSTRVGLSPLTLPFFRVQLAKPVESVKPPAHEI